jgi:hypothetical protein
MPLIIRIPHGRRKQARAVIVPAAPPRLRKAAPLPAEVADMPSVNAPQIATVVSNSYPSSRPTVVGVAGDVGHSSLVTPKLLVASVPTDSLPRAVDTLAGVPDAVVARKPPPRPAAFPLSSAHPAAEGTGRGCIEGSPRPDTRPSGETGATGPVGADLAATHVSLRRARLHHERVLRGEACRVESFAALQRARVEWRVVRCV